MTSGYLADTSVFVAAEQRRPIGELPPGDARISVATLTELIVGARRASGDPLRVLREATLARARSLVALPHDEPVAERLGELLATARVGGQASWCDGRDHGCHRDGSRAVRVDSRR